MSQCEQLTFESLNYAFDKLRTLHQLEFTNIENSTFSLKLANLHSLSELNLTNNANVDDETVKDICRNCLLLEKITFARCQVTDAGFVYIERLKCLFCLDLNHCKQITDATVNILSKMVKLEILKCVSCNKLTDISMKELAKNSKNLRYLLLTDCELVTDECIVVFREHVKNKNFQLIINVSGTQISEIYLNVCTYGQLILQT